MYTCPTDIDQLVELYCLNRLPDQEVERFEEHLLICVACQLEVEETREFLAALIAVLRETYPHYPIPTWLYQPD